LTVLTDTVVVGAGVFGVWIASRLQRSGRNVLLVDAYGVATSRGSSGGETRLIRAGYGADALYTRAARSSLEAWRALEEVTGLRLFEPTGVLTFGHSGDRQTEETYNTLCDESVNVTKLSRNEILARVPALAVPEDVWGVFEPDAGVLHARRGVEAVAAETKKMGVAFGLYAVAPPAQSRFKNRLDSIDTATGDHLTAEAFVFACGPWLPLVFPDLLRPRLFVTRQEVMFFGPPPGAREYGPEMLPAWIDFRDGVYGHADLGRGVKIAVDRHGPPIDPDSADRLVDPAAVAAVRRELASRLPGLSQAPLLETRVCQYENSSNGDFIIDRHPDLENVWIAGGGSGHGFKHGPFVADYLLKMMDGRGTAEPRFSLARKGTVQRREVY
jgi:glycine/D-amino acid oxidase-like deaminating enzyme